MFDWIKRHKILSIVSFILFIFMVFVVPIIIHFLFKWHPTGKLSFLIAEWSAGEFLQYHGCVLAFSGTVILGALSLYQNDIIKQESDKRIAMQEKREHDSNMPRFRVKFLHCSGNNSNMSVRVENISDNVANDILVYNICAVRNKNKIWENPNTSEYEVIKANDEIKVELGNKEIREDKFSFQFNFKCNDKYGDEHKYHACALYENNRSALNFSLQEISSDCDIT